MINIPAHIRIFDPAPDDDLVTKRTAAIKDLSARFSKGKQLVPAIFQAVEELARAVEAKGGLSEAFAQEVEATIRKSATAFVAEGQELQMIVCALLGALQAIDSAQPSKAILSVMDVFAIGAWSALSFQAARSEAKLEALRGELLERSRKFTLATAISSRERTKVPDFSYSPSEKFESAAIGDAFRAGARATIDALRSNAVVDREEIDLLWWVLADHSDLLNRRLSNPEGRHAAAIASGLEVGRLLRRMPLDAHHHLVLRSVPKADPLNLLDLIKSLDTERDLLAAPYKDNSTLAECPTVFPLLTAVVSGVAKDGKAKLKRTMGEWAGRALLESAALHVTAHVPSVLV